MSISPMRSQHRINEDFIEGLKDPRVHYIHLDQKNLPNARNEALAYVSSPVVLFLDDDVILIEEDFLETHLSAFDNPRVGGVTGRTLERSLHCNTQATAMHVTLGGRTIINLTGTERRLIPGLKGANMSFRREVFDSIGGFDRNYIGSAILEDIDFSARLSAAGWQMIFEPKAELLHLVRPFRRRAHSGCRGSRILAVSIDELFHHQEPGQACFGAVLFDLFADRRDPRPALAFAFCPTAPRKRNPRRARDLPRGSGPGAPAPNWRTPIRNQKRFGDQKRQWNVGKLRRSRILYGHWQSAAVNCVSSKDETETKLVSTELDWLPVTENWDQQLARRSSCPGQRPSPSSCNWRTARSTSSKR